MTNYLPLTRMLVKRHCTLRDGLRVSQKRVSLRERVAAVLKEKKWSARDVRRAVHSAEKGGGAKSAPPMSISLARDIPRATLR